MAKIARKNMKIFGSTPDANQMGEFGSLYNGAAVYTTDVETIQSQANWLVGLYHAVIGGNSPAIQDINSIFFVYAYQLAYLMQEGVAEWNSLTTYYIGSVVNDGTGLLYASLVDTNLNQAITDTTKWKPLAAQTNIVSIDPATQSPYTLTAADIGKSFEVNSANGAMTFTLPVAAANFAFKVKDVAGSLSINNITLARHGSESIENLAANYVMKSDFGDWGVGCNGTNWWINP